MNEQVEKLNRITNEMAEVLLDIRQKIMGRGISPAHASIFQAKLSEVEARLRQIGSNGNNLVPDDSPIRNLRFE